MPQLVLLLDDSGNLISILVKIVDDPLLIGMPKTTSSIIEKIDANFKLGTIAN